MTHDQFVSSPSFRQRYWSRSLVGFDTFSSARPNLAHSSFARLEANGFLCSAAGGVSTITQNVDGLHQRAGSKNVVDLHGCGHDVVCLHCGKRGARLDYHKLLRDVNPDFVKLVEKAAAAKTPSSVDVIGGDGASSSSSSSSSSHSSIRPDGDAAHDFDTSSFLVLPCPFCGIGVVKPDVTFFGSNVSADIVSRCMSACGSAEGLIVAGSSLSVYSAFRFVKSMHKEGKPVAIINVGGTRVDEDKSFWGEEGERAKNIWKREVGVSPFFSELVRVLEKDDAKS